MEQIELIRAKPEDAALVHALQLEAFWQLYQLYHDDETSPAKESIERILEKITDPNGEFYIIHLDKRPIGGIRIRHYENGRKLENVNWISPLFIIPGFQNKGIAQQVIRMVMDSYPSKRRKTAIYMKNAVSARQGMNTEFMRECH